MSPKNKPVDLLAALEASLKRGLADSAARRTKDLGDFSQYAKDTTELLYRGATPSE